MSGVNKVILIGNLGGDPEVRHLENGVTVATFNLATSETYKDRQTGERREQTEWHRVVTWRGLAEVVEKYLKKGSKVYVEGKLRTRKWEKDGIERYSTEIQADEMTMLDRPDRPAGNVPASTAAQGTSVVQEPMPVGGTSADTTDDLPF